MKHSNISFSHAGFTILELLVASLLLGMLVTMLTMIFNQSSIAWRTGISSVSFLEDTRKEIGGSHDIADDALPSIAGSGNTIKYRTVSLFRNWKGGIMQTDQSQYRGRLVDQIDWTGTKKFDDAQNAMKGDLIQVTVEGNNPNGRSGYIVGVRSSGPDRDMSTEDDNIDTFPEEVD